MTTLDTIMTLMGDDYIDDLSRLRPRSLDNILNSLLTNGIDTTLDDHIYPFLDYLDRCGDYI